jgi:hypothetical protein
VILREHSGRLYFSTITKAIAILIAVADSFSGSSAVLVKVQARSIDRNSGAAVGTAAGVTVAV